LGLERQRNPPQEDPQDSRQPIEAGRPKPRVLPIAVEEGLEAGGRGAERKEDRSCREQAKVFSVSQHILDPKKRSQAKLASGNAQQEK